MRRTEAPTCPRCGGTGAFVDEARCCVCDGAGRLPPDRPLPRLKHGQREFLERIGRSGDEGFTDRDWSLAFPLRDAGLIAPVDHPAWRLVPFFGAFRRSMDLTWLGRAVLDDAAAPVG